MMFTVVIVIFQDIIIARRINIFTIITISSKYSWCRRWERARAIFVHSYLHPHNRCYNMRVCRVRKMHYNFVTIFTSIHTAVILSNNGRIVKVTRMGIFLKLYLTFLHSNLCLRLTKWMKNKQLKMTMRITIVPSITCGQD